MVVELHPDVPISIQVIVEDADVTGYERIVSVECRLSPEAIPAAETERALPATGLAGSSVILILVRALRQDDPDPAARETAKGLFGKFQGAALPAGAAGLPGRFVELSGQISAAFGGPAVAFLRLEVREHGKAAIVRAVESHVGAVGPGAADSVRKGWTTLLGRLKEHVERASSRRRRRPSGG